MGHSGSGSPYLLDPFPLGDLLSLGSFCRRLGVEMGKVQVYQEANRGE